MKKLYEKPSFLLDLYYFDVIVMSGNNNIVEDPYDGFDDDWFGGKS